MAEELGLPELDDFADIMRLSGEEGASVYATLRARSAAMRTAMLNDEIAQANAVGERMTIPGSLLGVIFMALLVAPSLLRMFTTLVTTEGHIHRRKPMLKVLVLLQIAALSKYDDLRAARRSERGSVTTEHVLWAVAVIAIVGDRRRRGEGLCHVSKPATSSSRRRRRDERGSVSIELVDPAARPLRGHVPRHAGRALLPRPTVAIAAAQEGARAAGAEQGSESDGVGAANDFLAEAGGDDVLTGTSTSANRTATTATVTVSGFSLSVIPGWKVRDHAERERARRAG